MLSPNGTPTTLKQSIENGMVEGMAAAMIEKHVIDFLAQRFGATMLEAHSPEEFETLKNLFEKITGRKVK